MPYSDDEQVRALRDWKHRVAVPTLEAYGKHLDSLESRMGKVEEKVERMARADEIATAVADNLHSRRGLWFTGWTKAGAFVVGLAIVATAAKAWGLG